MKGLKVILVLTYVIIILLLLLSLKKCNNNAHTTIAIKEKFNADVVMCIDCTSSMSSIIGTIKNNALNFYPDIKKRCVEQGKEILYMRVKVIAFGDFCDEQLFEESSFYSFPEQEKEFKSYVHDLKDYGGGDEPERAYDALSMAIQSNWSNNPNTRKVIILWTDVPSHPLSGTANSGIRDFDELTSIWNTKLPKESKRLIMFAPSHATWNIIENNWDNAKRHDVTTGGGLTDVDYNEILKTLSESI